MCVCHPCSHRSHIASVHSSRVVPEAVGDVIAHQSSFGKTLKLQPLTTSVCMRVASVDAPSSPPPVSPAASPSSSPPSSHPPSHEHGPTPEFAPLSLSAPLPSPSSLIPTISPSPTPLSSPRPTANAAPAPVSVCVAEPAPLAEAEAGMAVGLATGADASSGELAGGSRGSKGAIGYSSLRVAFVDDEPPNQRVGVRFLKGLGIQAAHIYRMNDGALFPLSPPALLCVCVCVWEGGIVY